VTRADEVVAAARVVLERDGVEGLTMRAVAAELHIKAPSLYKHVAGKAAIEAELVALALAEMGQALHGALTTTDGASAGPGARDRVATLLAAHRRHALAHPNLYRLATAGPLPRHQLPPGLDDWAGEPFLTVTGDPHRAQALWAYAHGMVILELDRRFPAGSELDVTWSAGASAFASSADLAGDDPPTRRSSGRGAQPAVVMPRTRR
jgi:AcrR family transcriptional regulator